MSTKKRPSGAQFKKMKREREEKESKLTKIDSFCKKIKVDTSEYISESEKDEALIPQLFNEDVSNIDESKSELCNMNLTECTNIDEKFQFSEDEDNFLEYLSKEKYPSDRGHYGRNLNISSRVKRFILECGPCRPKGPFSEHHYRTTNTAGMIFSRTWLCYSKILNSCYCEPCWLFGGNLHQRTWVDGYNDWTHLATGIGRHEASKTHIQALAVYDLWKTGGTIDEIQEEEVKKEAKIMRKVIDRVMRVVLMLAQDNSSFRGTSEHIGPEGAFGGRFLSAINLLATYDPVLKELLEQKERTTKYLSPLIQNELIELLSSIVRNKILDEVRDAPFFSIVLDTTPDITRIDQLSIVFRYVKIIYDNNQKPVDIQVKESFIEFNPIYDHTAGGLEDVIKSFLEKNKINFSKCRGQAYDGTAVMSGPYTGLQARLQKLQKHAKYVHCAAHNLNLVINDAVKGVSEATDFFDTLGDLYKFFSASVKRWKELHSEGKITSVAIKRLCATRWASRDDALKSLRKHYSDVMRALTYIILTSKGNEKSEAMGLLKKLENFNFIVMLELFSKIFSVIGPLSKYLQTKSIDMQDAETYISKACEYTTNLRGSFKDIKDTAIEMALTWGVNTDFQEKRIHRVTQRFGELCLDNPIENAEKRFRVEVFIKVLDIIKSRLDERFKSFRSVVSKFKVLSPNVLLNVADNEVLRLAKLLSDEYMDDLDSETFPQEMINFRVYMKDEIKKAKSTRELTEAFICKHSHLSSCFKEVAAAYILFATLPVTSATTERSFSKLKLIKNFLRTKMTQERLSSLALLSIEHEKASEIDIDEAIKMFVSAKAGRKKYF